MNVMYMGLELRYAWESRLSQPNVEPFEREKIVPLPIIFSALGSFNRRLPLTFSSLNVRSDTREYQACEDSVLLCL